jgi:hypothetical protein
LCKELFELIIRDRPRDIPYVNIHKILKEISVQMFLYLVLIKL